MKWDFAAGTACFKPTYRKHCYLIWVGKKENSQYNFESFHSYAESYIIEIIKLLGMDKKKEEKRKHLTINTTIYLVLIYWFHVYYSTHCCLANDSFGDFNVVNCWMIYFQLYKLYTVFDFLILIRTVLPNGMINSDKGCRYLPDV